MMKISVVMPVYNVAEYLSKCLDSIICQTLQDIEIICVNDGSTDESLKILQEYKSRDKRIIIIDKQNENSGVARNAGLAIAQGEYVYFADSDDWIYDENVFEKIYAKAKDDALDILIFGGYSCYQNEGKTSKTKGGYSLKTIDKKYFDKVLSAEDIAKDVFKFPSTCWTKLYNRKFLINNDIKFQSIKIGQDQLPFFHSMITAKRIEVINECLYCYRKNRRGSAMTVKKKQNSSPVRVTKAIEELLKRLNLSDKYAHLAISKYFGKATSWLGKFEDELKTGYYEEYMELLTYLQNNYAGWWKYFNPELKDGYWTLKMKQFVAEQKNLLLK